VIGDTNRVLSQPHREELDRALMSLDEMEAYFNDLLDVEGSETGTLRLNAAHRKPADTAFEDA
jgi:hypothetical protein